jgi:dynein heavy chain
MNLEDIVMFTGMGLPGAGRTVITPRFLRHFNLLMYTELDELSIK